MSICFITCCSKNKASGGDRYEKYNYKPIPDPEILRTRSTIRRRILKGEIRGNLRGAISGQDFGGMESGLYLPAQERYSPGSFVSSLFRALGDNSDLRKLWLDENALFFVSGLYGLAAADEPIQNYDVHLDDTKTFWKKETLTRRLRTLIERLNCNLVLDCTADAEYSQMIDWNILSEQFQVLHAIGERFEDSQVRSAAGETAATADGKVSKERITRGEIILNTDADIRFVSSGEFIQARNRADQEARIRGETIGFIAIDEREFAAFKKGPGRFLNRFFEFVLITSKDSLINAKNKGCRQCICRITLPKHKEYQLIFGKENIHEAIKEAGLEPVTIKNGYSNLRLKFVVD